MKMLPQKAWMLLVGLVAFALIGCAQPAPEVVTKPDPLGNFKLGFAVAVADKAKKGPLSRIASQAELAGAMQAELDRVFKPYEGTKFYNLGVSVDAYALALPGIPILASPKSALAVTLSVWDDKAEKMILEKPQRFTVLEKISGKSFFGSGLTQTREEQLASLTHSAVQQIQTWMRKNESLFQDPEAVVTAP